MNPSIAELTKYIADNFQFTPEKYPELSGLSDEEQLRFAIRHSALHFAKTAGKIAANSENVDHGDAQSFDDLKLNIAKSLVNTLRLAELLHMSEEEIVKLVRQSVESPINKIVPTAYHNPRPKY